MAINVDYSPISSALGLAAQAGQGQRRRQQQQVDLQTIGLAQEMQRAADQRHAQEIQQSLEEQRIGLGAQENADRNRTNSIEQQAQEAYRQQALAQQKDYHDQQLSQQKEIAGTANSTRQQNADLAATKFQTQQDAIGNLPPDQQNVVRAQGHLPSAGQDESRLLIAEYRRLSEVQRQAIKDQQAAAYDPNDTKKILYEPSSTNPQAIKGMEAAFDAAARRSAAAAQRMQQIDEALSGKTSLLQPGAPTAVPAQSVQQIIQANEAPNQQSAPGQQPRILARERNPQDGKMWGFDANQGRWIPLE
jgi:hypothetical protein